MNLTPKNRYIRIEELSTITPEKKGFILPENYEPPPEEYDYFRVISQAEDCTLALKNGDTIAVERHMVKNLVFHKEKYLLVLENYVLASLADG